VVKSIVTTPLIDAICERQGVRCIATLVGFKWIAAKAQRWSTQLAEQAGPEATRLPFKRRAPLALRHSMLFVTGLEESHGYLADEGVRDKDANASVLLLTEYAAYLRASGRSLLDALDALHHRHGAHAEGLLNVVMEGAAGAAAIRRLLNSWQSKPPALIAGSKVTRVLNLAAGTAQDAEGQTLPCEDFLLVDLADGRRLGIRASGTEPKIKFYGYARRAVNNPDDLAQARQQAQTALQELLTWAGTDARQRSQ